MNQRLRQTALLLSLLLLTTHVPYAFALSSTADTDGDGITDDVEDVNGTNVMDAGETNPYNADTDGGGEADGTEVAGGRNPLDPTDDMTYDADGDGWVNGIEAQEKTDPQNKDTDGDGILDPLDPFPLDSKYQIDTNANHLPDEWETATGLSKNSATPMTTEDPDGDSLTNAEELVRGTNPLQADTDRDGLDDKTELDSGADPKENPCLSYEPTSREFSDMQNHWALTIVSRLSSTLILPDMMPVIRGYAVAGDTQLFFNPDKPVTRFEFLKMVMLSTCSKIHATALREQTTFTDVPKNASSDENADSTLKRKLIYSAVHYGIITGYDDGTFRPDALVNRSEALKILSLAANLQEFPDAATVSFSDVPASEWFAPYVRAAASHEIIGGYSDGTFRPSNPITRAEAAKIVYLTMKSNPVINGYVLPTE